MHDLDLHEAAHILIELGHQEIHIKAVVKLPALADHGITQDIAQVDGVHIVAFVGREILDVGELDWGWD